MKAIKITYWKKELFGYAGYDKKDGKKFVRIRKRTYHAEFDNHYYEIECINPIYYFIHKTRYTKLSVAKKVVEDRFAGKDSKYTSVNPEFITKLLDHISMVKKRKLK